MQRLTGKAQDWAAAFWCANDPICADYPWFLQWFKTVFDHPDQGRSSGRQLLKLHQGSNSADFADFEAADFAIQFCILTAETGWNDAVFIEVFCTMLNLELQMELACRDTDMGLGDLITLAIRLDQHLRGRMQHTTSSPKVQAAPKAPRDMLLSLMLRLSRDISPEPMQLGTSWLMEEELPLLWRGRPPLG